MRLASKIFLGFSLVIVVLAAVGVFGLRAIGRLVSVNREIASETLPALRLTTGVRDSLLTMGRLEARFAILRDRRYADLWRESAAHARADLIRLTDLVHSGPEATRLAAARMSFRKRARSAGRQSCIPAKPAKAGMPTAAARNAIAIFFTNTPPELLVPKNEQIPRKVQSSSPVDQSVTIHFSLIWPRCQEYPDSSP